MPLDPEVLPLLAAAPQLPYSQQPVEQVRRGMLAVSQGLNDEVSLADVSDVVADPPGRRIPLRIYRPHQPNGGAVVYFHGGGWVIGSIDTHDGYCRCLAHDSRTTVVSVDYRLAPEHPFPAAADDAAASAQWVIDSAKHFDLDPQRIGVGGDSAGGNLAAVATQQLPPPCKLACQVLIYPIVDCDLETPSYRENGEGYLLTREAMEWFWNQYLPSPDARTDPKASPLRAHDLRGLPPALVLTAEFDPLRDEGEQYARRLADSGVDVDLKRYDGMVHGFVRRMRALKAARRALRRVSQFLAERMRK